eukprot:7973021-Pyramimonas_sp.AAC.1
MRASLRRLRIGCVGAARGWRSKQARGPYCVPPQWAWPARKVAWGRPRRIPIVCEPPPAVPPTT